MNSLLWIAYAVLWCCSCYSSYLGWGVLFERYKTYREKELKLAGPVDAKRLCTNDDTGFRTSDDTLGSHTWITIRWREDEDVCDVRACEACGFIPSKDAMVPIKALPAMQLWYRRNQVLEEAKNEFTQSEEAVVNALTEDLYKGVDANKISAFYSQAVTTKERLTAYLDQRVHEFYEQEVEDECNHKG